MASSALALAAACWAVSVVASLSRAADVALSAEDAAVVRRARQGDISVIHADVEVIGLEVDSFHAREMRRREVSADPSREIVHRLHHVLGPEADDFIVQEGGEDGLRASEESWRRATSERLRREATVVKSFGKQFGQKLDRTVSQKRSKSTSALSTDEPYPSALTPTPTFGTTRPPLGSSPPIAPPTPRPTDPSAPTIPTPTAKSALMIPIPTDPSAPTTPLPTPVQDRGCLLGVPVYITSKYSDQRVAIDGRNVVLDNDNRTNVVWVLMKAGTEFGMQDPYYIVSQAPLRLGDHLAVHDEAVILRTGNVNDEKWDIINAGRTLVRLTSNRRRGNYETSKSLAAIPPDASVFSLDHNLHVALVYNAADMKAQNFQVTLVSDGSNACSKLKDPR